MTGQDTATLALLNEQVGDLKAQKEAILKQKSEASWFNLVERQRLQTEAYLVDQKIAPLERTRPVSYTHLTLPTSDLV